MGSIHFPAGRLFGSLSDIIGTKSGLALTKPQIFRIFEEEGRFQEYRNDAYFRVHSTEFEEMVELLLYKVGRLESINNVSPMAALIRKYGRDKDNIDVITDIGDMFLSMLNEFFSTNPPPNTTIDPSSFMRQAMQKHGKRGLDMAYDVIQAQATQLEIKSAHFPVIREWKNIIELNELFASEGLMDQQGAFVDQRYIDYINRNFEQIDEIHWRKFEGLTADYFARQGFQIELGPGRNDDGVDVRVWPSGEALDKPPAIIIQCKRQKAPISKVIVKSLYADVLHYQAKSGLIVTTSELSPGAKATHTVRSYPVSEANRENLRQWIAEMRKPGMGVAE